MCIDKCPPFVELYKCQIQSLLEVNMIYLDVKIIDTDQLATYWPQCAPLLEMGLATSDGEMPVEYLLHLIEIRQGFLVAGVDALGTVHVAMALQFQEYPNYTVAHIHSIGGRWVLANRRHWDAIKEWMKAQGARKVQGSCRPAQARLWQWLGLKPVYQIMRQDL